MKYSKGFVVFWGCGVVFTVCLIVIAGSAAPQVGPIAGPEDRVQRAPTYNITVNPAIYTRRGLDPNDPIYTGLSIDPVELRQYGDCERTLVIYNCKLARLQIAQLHQRLTTVENLLLKMQPPEPPDANDPNGG